MAEAPRIFNKPASSIPALIEALMQRTLWRVAGVSDATAKAVFSGVRTDAAMQYINRVAAAERWSVASKATLQMIFSQLGQINKLRNNILHYGATEGDEQDTWIISNKRFAHLPENISQQAISWETLDSARYDLDKIEYHLIFLVQTTGHIPGPDEAEIYAVLGRAWRYKPPPQAGDRQSSPETRQAP